MMDDLDSCRLGKTPSYGAKQTRLPSTSLSAISTKALMSM